MSDHILTDENGKVIEHVIRTVPKYRQGDILELWDQFKNQYIMTIDLNQTNSKICACFIVDEEMNYDTVLNQVAKYFLEVMQVSFITEDNEICVYKMSQDDNILLWVPYITMTKKQVESVRVKLIKILDNTKVFNNNHNEYVKCAQQIKISSLKVIYKYTHIPDENSYDFINIIMKQNEDLYYIIDPTLKLGKSKEIRIKQRMDNNNEPEQRVLPDDPMDDKELYEWQRQMTELYKDKCDKNDRTIHYIVDLKGNAGKSTYIKHIRIENLHKKRNKDKEYKNILYIDGGDKKNIICYVDLWLTKNPNEHPDVIFIDIPRASETKKISYAAMESIKNGMIFNTKYTPGDPMFNTPHVIILSNSWPEKAKFSDDRWKVYEIDHDKDLNKPMKDISINDIPINYIIHYNRNK
jgi:hypothetical protein